MDQVESLFHLIEPLRVELDLFQIIAQVVNHIRDRINQHFGLIRQLALRRINLCQRSERLRGLPNQIRCGGSLRRAFLQHSQRLLRVLRQRLGIRKPITLFAQLFLFARFQTRGFDLLRLIREKFHAAIRIRLRFTQFIQLVAHAEQRMICLTIFAEGARNFGEAVKQTQMGA